MSVAAIHSTILQYTISLPTIRLQLLRYMYLTTHRTIVSRKRHFLFLLLRILLLLLCLLPLKWLRKNKTEKKKKKKKNPQTTHIQPTKKPTDNPQTTQKNPTDNPQKKTHKQPTKKKNKFKITLKVGSLIEIKSNHYKIC
uniref:Uncharacterized protein n=2 Tax=Cacopsylla melanoneura TaxID=428564 RepID=A0A8D9B1D8_9HEMI